MKRIVYVLIFMLIFSGCANNGKKENNEVDSTQKNEKVASDTQEEDNTLDLFADGNGIEYNKGEVIKIGGNKEIHVKKFPYINANTFINLEDYVRENAVDLVYGEECKVDKARICKDKEVSIYRAENGFYVDDIFFEDGDTYPEIFLIDLNKNDEYKEIGVYYWLGPEWGITIYGYDGEKMVEIGWISDKFGMAYPYVDPETGTIVWNTLGFLPEGAVYSTLKIENNNFYCTDYKDIKEYVMDRNVLLDDYNYHEYKESFIENESDSMNQCIFLKKGDRVKVLDIEGYKIYMKVNGKQCYAFCNQ